MTLEVEVAEERTMDTVLRAEVENKIEEATVENEARREETRMGGWSMLHIAG